MDLGSNYRDTKSPRLHKAYCKSWIFWDSLLTTLLAGMNDRSLAKKARAEKYTLKQLFQEASKRPDEQENRTTDVIEAPNGIEAPIAIKEEKNQTHKKNQDQDQGEQVQGAAQEPKAEAAKGAGEQAAHRHRRRAQ